MDFITKLPRTKEGHDMIWVIVNRLTKPAHFLAIREKDSTEKSVKKYIKEIVSSMECRCRSFQTEILVFIRIFGEDFKELLELGWT
jgi:hypothetical protein